MGNKGNIFNERAGSIAQIAEGETDDQKGNGRYPRCRPTYSYFTSPFMSELTPERKAYIAQLVEASSKKDGCCNSA
jgi:hypothetical protein